LTVCVIDQDPVTYESLRPSFAAVLWFRTAESFIADVACQADDVARATSVSETVIVADVELAGIGGIELIRQLRERRIDIPVILVCRNADVATAVDAIRQGAADFVEKPIHADRLVNSVQRLHADDS
jgi:FixJ family two-component response regulator